MSGIGGRYVYAEHIRDDMKCPQCGASAVAQRHRGVDHGRRSYVMKEGVPRFVRGDNPLFTNVVIYGDCECGAAVPFSEPGDIVFIAQAEAPAASGLTPLFYEPENAIAYGEKRRRHPGIDNFSLAVAVSKGQL